MAEYTWYNVTTWADRDWRVAQAAYWDGYAKLRGWQCHDGPDHRALRNRLRVARADYQCVPDSVAELLAEEWDERTAYRQPNTAEVHP